MYLSIEIYKGNDSIFVATCPELELFSNASTQEEAVEKLKSNIMSYLNSIEESKSTEEDLKITFRYYTHNRPEIH